MTTPVEVRGKLVEALQLDLVGSLHGVAEHGPYVEEELSSMPSSWYLTGFLAPQNAPQSQRADPTVAEHDEVQTGGIEDDKRSDTPAARRAFYPASMGLSVLVPKEVHELFAHVAWGDYVKQESGSWKRKPRTAETPLPLAAGKPQHVSLPGSGGMELVISVRPVEAGLRLPAGTRAVSVFLVNARHHAADDRRDEAFAFQAELTLKSPQPFVPRPDLRGGDRDGWDEKVAELQYLDAVEYAVGHNVSGKAIVHQSRCREVCTTWLPQAEVEKVVPADIPGVELGMEALAQVQSGAELRTKVGALLSAYEAWIDKQPARLSSDRQTATAAGLLANARHARGRIDAGLAALDQDARALEAFRLANRAVARALRQRWCHDEQERKPQDAPLPKWRPFQLAFLLLNLPGLVDQQSADRRVVDLLFFPTGGGKTEAYLGLAAFAMVLRRLRDPSARSSGVTVLMRYTLRLLTLDQLVRAATLVCALELERQGDVDKLGAWPFEIGLWVGLAATPNRMGKKSVKDDNSARTRTRRFKLNDKKNPSPIPLEGCPWCGWRFNKDSFHLLPNSDEPEELRIFCRQRLCPFHADRAPRGLPLLAVDDQIYRRLPAFVIATVDKFASLPWEGRTGALLGHVERHDAKGFYGPCEPGSGNPLGGSLPPPDLIIQDELQLISGPLGTMVGLYETAIDELCRRGDGDKSTRPKIVASTATVRQAARQIQALFGRSGVDVFPPPGPNRRDSFFARTVPSSEKNARLYVGVAAQGRNLKVVMLRAYLALLGASQKHWQINGGKSAPQNPADPYMTLLGYFNTLRELGGARRIVEDEVASRAKNYGTQRRRAGESEGLFADRSKVHVEELTSRRSTAEVSETRGRLALAAAHEDALPVVLATNMISVGLDITRLGLMVVNGQPKAAAEYIQATSRVGRDDERPGLVVTLLNLHKPRDRSHYERFTSWHECFYRAVEATSVTPFSPRAIDRGLAGVTVALARLGNAPMTRPQAAAEITAHRQEVEKVATVLADRAKAHDKDLPNPEDLRQSVRARVLDLLDSWARVADEHGSLQYGREIGGPRLLRDPLDPELDKCTSDERKFRANRSLRDVEPTVSLWLYGAKLGDDQ